MNKNQKLGIKVFYYYLSRKTSIGIFALVVSIIVSSYKSILISKVDLLAPTEVSSIIVSYFIYGLFALTVALIIFGLIMSWINYISCDFTLDENAFNIRRGFLTKREVSIPYRQIQNINIEQSLSHKMLGIGKLVILTEGDHSNLDENNREGVFEVIDYSLAHQVREFILQRTNLQIIKDVDPSEKVTLN